MQPAPEAQCGVAQRGVGVHRREDGELLAAEAGEQVTGAQHRLQPGGHHAQQVVPGGVAECVVDLLELVQVQQRQGQRGAVATQLVHPAQHRATVGQTGQLVGHGLPAGDGEDGELPDVDQQPHPGPRRGQGGAPGRGAGDAVQRAGDQHSGGGDDDHEGADRRRRGVRRLRLGAAGPQDGGHGQARHCDRLYGPAPAARLPAGQEDGRAAGEGGTEGADDQPGAGVASHGAQEGEGGDGSQDDELDGESGRLGQGRRRRRAAERAVAQLDDELDRRDHGEDGGRTVERVVGVGEVGAEAVPPDEPAVDEREGGDRRPQRHGDRDVLGGRGQAEPERDRHGGGDDRGADGDPAPDRALVRHRAGPPDEEVEQTAVQRHQQQQLHRPGARGGGDGVQPLLAHDESNSCRADDEHRRAHGRSGQQPGTQGSLHDRVIGRARRPVNPGGDAHPMGAAAGPRNSRRGSGDSTA